VEPGVTSCASSGTSCYLSDALLPFGGIFNWTGGTIGEGNDTGLAIAAEVLGRHDDADRHHADAIALCERAGARSYLARVHYFHGVGCSPNAATR
jgi:hypothetical protein